MCMPAPEHVFPRQMDRASRGDGSYVDSGHSGEITLGEKPSLELRPLSAQEIESFLKIRTKRARQMAMAKLQPIPSHWKAPSNPIGRALFYTLSLFAFGHVGLDPIWASIKLEQNEDESAWEERMSQLSERLSSLNVTAGLLLATCATFLTTPPPDANFANYIVRGPYLCIFGAFALLVGGIIVGSTSLHIGLKVGPGWCEKVMYKDTFHVYCTLLLLAYPFIVAGVATMLLAFGLLSAVWVAHDHAVQGACVIVLILPISMGALFYVSCATAAGGGAIGRQLRRVM